MGGNFNLDNHLSNNSDQTTKLNQCLLVRRNNELNPKDSDLDSGTVSPLASDHTKPLADKSRVSR